MYAFPGDMRSDVADESREVHCLRANLSEQDLDDVEGLSARASMSSMKMSMLVEEGRLTWFAPHNAKLGE